ELLLWKSLSFEEIKKNLIQISNELKKISENDFNSFKIKEILDNLSGKNKGPYFWPLRVALSGKEASPPPFDLAEAFGKDFTLKLINKAIQKL
ncbi:MAG: glutamate--tRNA ligase, partial [Patescibacteria group bacterium]